MLLRVRFTLILVITSVVLLGQLAAADVDRATVPGQTYTNPILPIERGAGADPSVLWHEGKWYFYSTNPGLNVFSSDDLVHWEKGPQLLPDDFKRLWAPDLYYHPEDGKFYNYYTKRYKIGVAAAGHPEGPFEDLGFLAIPAIDAHLFRDDDGRLYLYFTQTPSFTMYCVPMKSPTETGGPVTKCFEISQAWERNSFEINEGPWMLKHNGTYYLLYSGSDGQSVYYAIGYATAPTPIGPWTKHAGNPVFQDLPEIFGPGHGSVTMDRTGQLWHLYHQKVSEEKGWARDINLDPVAFDENGNFGGTPTRNQPQPMPVVDPDLVWIPEIRPRGAVFNDSVTVELSTRTPGATIRYTLDGSDPTENSPAYSGPFVLDNSAMVSARAWKTGMTPGTVARQTFTQTSEAVPSNPAPDAAPGEFPFDVFETPVKDWRPLVEKKTD